MRRLATLDQVGDGSAEAPHRSSSRAMIARSKGTIVVAPAVWRFTFCLFALAVSAAITGLWFSPGRLLAGGDNFPPFLVDPDMWMRRMRYAWDLAGLGGPNELIQVLPQIVFNHLLRIVFAPAEAQRVFYALLYAAQFLSMSYLVLTILPGRRVAAIVAGLFYCFNPFVVLVPPGYLGLSLMVYLPYMGALFLRTVTAPLSAAGLAVFAVSASLSGILFVNPPLYMVFVWYAVFMTLYVVMQHWRSKVPLRLALLLVLFVAVNVYWIAQAYFVLFGSGHQQVVAAAAQDWGFVARRSSILNMFWLNPTWAWNYYYPYAPVYKTPLLELTIFLPALFTFSSLLNRSIPRRIVLPMLCGALLLLFVSTGLHGPWQDINLFLFQHIPLFWLFREPDAKFPFFILVLYAPLIGYQVDWLSERLADLVRRSRAGATIARVSLLTVVSLGFVVTAFPLVTGEVVGRSASSSVAPGVVLPDYWFKLKDYLARQDSGGVTLVLPNDDFYQMHYSWGYYGADVLPGEFIANRSTTINAAGGYIVATSGGVDLNGHILQALKDSGHPTILPYLAAQGVGYILQRNDIVTDDASRHILSAQQIRAYLVAQPYLHLVHSFGKLDLYQVDPRSFVPQMYAVALPHTAVGHLQQAKKWNARVMSALGLDATRGNVSRSSSGLPAIWRVSWTQLSPVRFAVQIGPTTQPSLLVLSTAYNPNWHACAAPVGTMIQSWTCWFNGFLPARNHFAALGLFNGWLIEPSRRHTVIIDLGTQHTADFASSLSFVTVTGVVLASVLLGCVRMSRMVRIGLRRQRPMRPPNGAT